MIFDKDSKSDFFLFWGEGGGLGGGLVHSLGKGSKYDLENFFLWW